MTPNFVTNVYSLAGSIEESLLQRCFVPTFHVPGFKVLLGASGGFCPTQLTIPSSTSFYELHGQCLSTPYLVSYFICIQTVPDV